MNLILLWALTAQSTSSDSATRVEEKNSRLTKTWGLSSLHPDSQHRFEGAFLVKSDGVERLELRIWHEEKSREATEAAACRLIHATLYGKNRLRKDKRSLIVDAFSSKSLSEIRGIFFRVDQKAIATSDEESRSTSKPQDPEPPSTPRVKWKRSEKIVPYLSWTLTRADFQRLESKFLRAQNPSFAEFLTSACGEISSLVPTLKKAN